MTQIGPDQNPKPDQLKQTTRRMRAAIVVAVVAMVALLSVLAVVFLRGDDESTPGAIPSTSASTTPTQPTASPTPMPTTTTPTAPSPTPTPTATAKPFAYQPLWPFKSAADAAVWQRSYRAGGHQPWHLDAEQTALSFTTGFLNFSEIDKVVSRSIRGDDARIAVGYQAGGGAPTVAAVIHLVKIGQGLDAPWEVVGTADTTLTLERPRYGATAVSPLTVGGRITGVDESIQVQVWQVSSDLPIGATCCVPAGGDRQPWSTRVTFERATDATLTVVASTGGHLQDVERFAVTGVRSGRPAPN